MAKVTIVGAGMMGSAMTLPLVDRGHEVRLVGTPLDQDIIVSLQREHVHPKLALELPASVAAYPVEQLGSALSGAELVVLGVSSAGVRWAAEALARFVDPAVPVLMITKGLEFDGRALRALPDVLSEGITRAGGPPLQPCAVAGPCIAGELARRVDTCVVFTGRDTSHVERCRELLAGGYYHVWTSADLLGVETCAALKNAYAMGIAFPMGLHEKAGGTPGSIALHNAEAATFAQSIVEMQLILNAVGGRPENAIGLPGVGDLDVTCNGGRTGRFGKLLGLGLPLPEAIARMQGATLECLDILRVLRAALPSLADAGLSPDDLPLLVHMMEVALDGAPVALPFPRFFRTRLSGGAA